MKQTISFRVIFSFLPFKFIQNPNLHHGFFFLGSSSPAFVCRKAFRFASSSNSAISAGAATATSMSITSSCPSSPRPVMPLSRAATSSGVNLRFFSFSISASCASAFNCANGSDSSSLRPTCFKEYVKTAAQKASSAPARARFCAVGGGFVSGLFLSTPDDNDRRLPTDIRLTEEGEKILAVESVLDNICVLLVEVEAIAAARDRAPCRPTTRTGELMATVDEIDAT